MILHDTAGVPGVFFSLVAVYLYGTTAPAYPRQDSKFVFVLFAGKSLFGHGVRCGNPTAAGYMIFIETGCLIEGVLVFIKCSTGETGNYHDT